MLQHRWRRLKHSSIWSRRSELPAWRSEHTCTLFNSRWRFDFRNEHCIFIGLAITCNIFSKTLIINLICFFLNQGILIYCFWRRFLLLNLRILLIRKRLLILTQMYLSTLEINVVSLDILFAWMLPDFLWMIFKGLISFTFRFNSQCHIFLKFFSTLFESHSIPKWSMGSNNFCFISLFLLFFLFSWRF